MTTSVFEVFKSGIGPSSSHTMGPMRAAWQFADALAASEKRMRVAHIRVEFHGSLAATGRGHCADVAVVAGLEGALPNSVDPDHYRESLSRVRAAGRLRLIGGPEVVFDPETDLAFDTTEPRPEHPNAVTFRALDESESLLVEETYFSVGGGRVCSAFDLNSTPHPRRVPHPYRSAAELLSRCAESGLSIPRLALENECIGQDSSTVRARLLALWAAMRACIDRGIASDGILPGSLGTRRRARGLFAKSADVGSSFLGDMQRVSAWATAVAEENAAGGRLVTAPTNGAAGVVPAVLMFYLHCCNGANEDGVVDFLLSAGAIGKLYIENASISGAEVGCQGEIGVACSMAAAGLAAALGGTAAQIEYAAEIGMEHNLGLTCDPIGGLVQVPCIERNAIASVKSIGAAQLALASDGTHLVALDRVIEVMCSTGRDMHRRYKETAEGGLAVDTVHVRTGAGAP